MRKKLTTIFIVLVAGGAAFAALRFSSGRNQPKPVETAKQPTVCLKTAESQTGCGFMLEEANTAFERTRGLSGRDPLPDKTGLLFTFDKPAEQCMWMKDMKFNIDIIWLNENKEINKIENGLSPDTYPTNYCSYNTKYVIELNEGAAKSSGLTIGQRLSF